MFSLFLTIHGVTIFVVVVVVFFEAFRAVVGLFAIFPFYERRVVRRRRRRQSKTVVQRCFRVFRSRRRGQTRGGVTAEVSFLQRFFSEARLLSEGDQPLNSPRRHFELVDGPLAVAFDVFVDDDVFDETAYRET